MTWITETMSALGLPGLFVLMGLESAGAPIPAEIVLPFGGYLVYLHRMSFLGALAATNLGGLAGFLLQYALGRLGGRPLLRKYGPYLLISNAHLDRAERWFAEQGPRAVFVARLLPVVRGLISLPAGAARMPLSTFILWSLAGAFPWTLGLVLAGWAAGAYWTMVVEWAHRIGLYLLLVAVVVACAWFMKRARFSQRAAVGQAKRASKGSD
jgi:membrane protein DedA with SNARE-associated domain